MSDTDYKKKLYNDLLQLVTMINTSISEIDHIEQASETFFEVKDDEQRFVYGTDAFWKVYNARMVYYTSLKLLQDQLKWAYNKASSLQIEDKQTY